MDELSGRLEQRQLEQLVRCLLRRNIAMADGAGQQLLCHLQGGFIAL